MKNLDCINKQNLINSIDTYLQDNKQEIVKTLIELVRIPSVRSDAEKNAPYGKGCDEMLNATAKLMTKHGFATVLRNDLGYTYSSYNNNSEKTIGLYSHGDVVSADGEWLVSPPFEPIIKDGFMFGRGCNDDKSGIVQMLYATKIIRELKIPLKNNILMFTGVSEETGMADIKAFKDKEKVPDAGLVIDGASYPCDFGERSFYKFDLISKEKLKSIKSFRGGNSFTYNIILPEVEVKLDYRESCFKQLKELTDKNDNFELSSNADQIILRAKGSAAPVSMPDDGINAGQIMIGLLVKCDYISKEDKKIGSVTTNG